jgi:hypothetical protein
MLRHDLASVLFALFSASFIVLSCIHTSALLQLKDKVGAKPEDDVWWTYPEDGRMDLDVHDRKRVLIKRVSSN